MWEQYKKTFWGMQAIICAAAVSIFLWGHVLGLSALFFATMQVGAVIGAMWAVRLKNKLERHATKLMSQPTPQPSR